MLSWSVQHIIQDVFVVTEKSSVYYTCTCACEDATGKVTSATITATCSIIVTVE